MNELTRREEMSLAGAALRGAPWKAAAISGGVVSAVNLGLGLITGDLDLTSALSLGITIFTLVASIGAIAQPEVADRVTRQARLWSLRHPWRFALYPGAGAAILMYPIQLIFDQDGVIGSAWDSLMGGVAVYLIAAVGALLFKSRAGSKTV